MKAIIYVTVACVIVLGAAEVPPMFIGIITLLVFCFMLYQQWVAARQRTDACKMLESHFGEKGRMAALSFLRLDRMMHDLLRQSAAGDVFPSIYGDLVNFSDLQDEREVEILLRHLRDVDAETRAQVFTSGSSSYTVNDLYDLLKAWYTYHGLPSIAGLPSYGKKIFAVS